MLTYFIGDNICELLQKGYISSPFEKHSAGCLSEANYPLEMWLWNTGTQMGETLSQLYVMSAVWFS